MDNIKSILKSNFTNIYNIPEVISYIDNINSVKIFKFNNLILKIFYNDNEYFNFNFIQKIIKRGAFLIKHKKIIINFIPSNAIKLIDEDDIMTAKNINSGFTYLLKDEIFIFRKEEFPKVFLHELIHHDLNIHNDIFQNINNVRLKSHFNISDNTILILNEAIIELWATIFQLAFISIDYNLNFKQLFNIELLYSLYKSYQILKIQKEKYNNIWYDKCNIYSYIIFKTILLLNLNKFINIYMYPNKYDDTLLTNFIIKHSNLPLINKNPYLKLFINGKSKKIFRSNNSLCFMLFSDL